MFLFAWQSIVDFVVDDDRGVGKQPVEIDNDQAVAGDAGEVVAADALQRRERWLQAGRLDAAQADHHVGEHADFEAVAAHDDDVVEVGDAALGQVEELADVDHRDHPAADVDDAEHEVRRSGQRRQLIESQHFGDARRRHGIAFVGEAEFEQIDRSPCARRRRGGPRQQLGQHAQQIQVCLRRCRMQRVAHRLPASTA